jgi:hypothetical protein
MLKTMLTGSQHPDVSLAHSFSHDTYADLELTSVVGQPNAATDTDIGAAEVYKAAVVFSHNPGGDAAPAWLANLTAAIGNLTVNVDNLTVQVGNLTVNVANLTVQVENLTARMDNLDARVDNLTATVNQMVHDVAYLRQKADEHPILLANSHAGACGPLFNPTVLQHGWAPLLTAPNPRSRDELVAFTGEFTSYFHTVILILFALKIVNQCIASAHSLGLPALPPQTSVLERRRQIAARIGVFIQ